MNKDNPAAVGAVLDSDYSLVPSDNIRITNNIQKAKQITTKLSSIGNEVKIMDNKLFNSSGKLQYGKEATHKAFEQQVGKIIFLQSRVRDILDNLFKLKEKSSRLFTVSYVKPMSKKGNKSKTEKKS